jgi:hypothetical protein
MIANEWRKRNLEMEDAEWGEGRKMKETALRLQATLREQMIVREERQRAEVQKEWEEARLMAEARAREDAVFEAYCTAQLGDLQIKGKSTVPLQLVLHHEQMKMQRPANYVPGNFRFR